MVEIYNETLRDLLTKDTRVMELRVGGNRVSIPGLVEKQVDNMVEVQSIMEMGANNRTVGETKMNSTRWGTESGGFLWEEDLKSLAINY